MIGWSPECQSAGQWMWLGHHLGFRLKSRRPALPPVLRATPCERSMVAWSIFSFSLVSAQFIKFWLKEIRDNYGINKFNYLTISVILDHFRLDFSSACHLILKGHPYHLASNLLVWERSAFAWSGRPTLWEILFAKCALCHCNFSVYTKWLDYETFDFTLSLQDWSLHNDLSRSNFLT